MTMVTTFEFQNFIASCIPLAKRRALIVASVPEDTIRIISIDGTRSITKFR